MITLYYWPTPNGHKITIFLEEAGVAYRIEPVNIGQGDQFRPEFLAISPNNRMPAIVDDAPEDGGNAISVFESGAILLYLSEKTKKFQPKDERGRVRMLEWLFWQSGRARADGRAEPPFRALRARKKFPTRSTAMSRKPIGLYGSARPSIAKARPFACAATTIRSPTWPPIHGSCRMRRRVKIYKIFPMSIAGSILSVPARGCSSLRRRRASATRTRRLYG